MTSGGTGSVIVDKTGGSGGGSKTEPLPNGSVGNDGRDGKLGCCPIVLVTVGLLITVVDGEDGDTLLFTVTETGGVAGGVAGGVGQFLPSPITHKYAGNSPRTVMNTMKPTIKANEIVEVVGN